MKTENLKFISKDNINIHYTKWTNEAMDKPKGVIQIAHGMAEHIARYETFAKELIDNGYIVYGNDHRGHGRTAGCKENIGYFADENGWDLVVNDMYELTNIIKKENENIPIFIFGHSMGSFLSRTYIQKYGNELEGVIICGTGGDPKIMGKLGLLITKRELKNKGKKVRSKKLDKLSFGNFNKSFKPNRTNFDWLSRDNNEVDKYINDPLCGEIFTTGFFYDMLTGIQYLNNKTNIDNIPKNLPIFIISGDKDPVGNNAKGVMQAYSSYVKAGIKDVSYKLYKDARHELLNETNREEIYGDIMEWLSKHC